MQNRNIKRYVILIIMLIVVLFLFLNEFGLVKYYKIRTEVSDLKEKIESTEKRIRNLEREIDSLKTENSKIEKVARERYYMLSPSERALKIEEK
ncbi:MAG: septum formation initiator family protein [Bacteroidetes bacterium]|nr:septum formation initiator family protein [Bacteroidota bacterium]MBU1678575.1 septum formation initiator family protein [Bacteroidota bacterium]MBU2505171.1 septum formation initiator family protein [Bacteroidota bacterium]